MRSKSRKGSPSLRDVPQEGGTSSLRAPAHPLETSNFMVSCRGEASLVPPYILCNFELDGAVAFPVPAFPRDAGGGIVSPLRAVEIEDVSCTFHSE